MDLLIKLALIKEKITLLMPEWDVARLQDIEYLPGGYSNLNYALSYDDVRYVLRIPQAKQPFVDRQHEQAWYAALDPATGVKPLAFDANTGAMLSPWINGRLLIDAWPELSVDDLATYLRTLHQQLPDNERDYDLLTINAAYWQNQAPPELPAPLNHQHLRSCHNDLNPWNILITDNGWVTLDWEFAANNDPLFDLVSLHQGLELPGAELQNFAHTYFVEPPQQLVPRLLAAQRAFWIRELGWAHFQISRGNDREEIQHQAVQARQALTDLKS